MKNTVVLCWNESYNQSVVTLLYTINDITVEGYTTCDVEEVEKRFSISLTNTPIVELPFEIGDCELIGLPFMCNHKFPTDGLYTRRFFSL